MFAFAKFEQMFQNHVEREEEHTRRTAEAIASISDSLKTHMEKEESDRNTLISEITAIKTGMRDLKHDIDSLALVATNDIHTCRANLKDEMIGVVNATAKTIREDNDTFKREVVDDIRSLKHDLAKLSEGQTRNSEWVNMLKKAAPAIFLAGLAATVGYTGGSNARETTDSVPAEKSAIDTQFS